MLRISRTRKSNKGRWGWGASGAPTSRQPGSLFLPEVPQVPSGTQWGTSTEMIQSHFLGMPF